jgi:hypothetical protein
MQDISLTTRTGAGKALTWQQLDANWTSLQSAVNALISAGYITQTQAQALITSTAIATALGYTPADAANTSQFQTASQVAAAIQSVVGAAPAALDTLQEIAAQLQNDESAVAALTNLVSGKADKSILSAIALSGSYADLSNKPSIPPAQIQSDWNQTNSSALDFIKNKPSISSGGAGAITLISTKSLSSGSCAWTGLSGYNRYKLIIDGVTISSQNSNGLQVQVGYGSTPTYITSGYINNAVLVNNNATLNQQGATSDSGIFASLNSKGVLYSFMDSFDIDIIGMNSTSMLSAMFRAIGSQNANGIETYIGQTKLPVTQVSNAIQVVGYFATLTGGTASLYGISQ